MLAKSTSVISLPGARSTVTKSKSSVLVIVMVIGLPSFALKLKSTLMLEKRLIKTKALK